MTTFDRFERELPDALLDVAGTRAPDYLADILGRTARNRQRPAWASLERWLPMELVSPRASTSRVPLRMIAVLAVVALLVVAGLVLLAGSQRPAVPAPFGPAGNGVIPYAADGDIHVGDPATGATRLLVGGPESDYEPTFSPDGTRIAFVREAPTGEDVYIVNHDGTGLRRVTPSPLGGLVSATWTPASDALVLGHDVDGRQLLQRFDALGSAPARTIAEGLDIDWFEYRPPVGAEVLFRGRVDGRYGLFLMNPDGTGIRPLVAGLATPPGRFEDNQDLNFPAWSPDGSRIYFNKYVPAASTVQAWVMDPDGSNPRRFNASAIACCWWEGEMAPSPDGRWVLMWRVAPDGSTGELTLYPADGSGEGRVIGPSLVGTARWTWSPDSTRILFNYNDAAEGDQLLIDPDTGQPIALPWTADTTPSWQRLAR